MRIALGKLGWLITPMKIVREHRFSWFERKFQ